MPEIEGNMEYLILVHNVLRDLFQPWLHISPVVDAVTVLQTHCLHNATLQCRH